MAINNPRFLLDASTLKLVIYSSMIIGNLLFVSLHAIHLQYGVIAALSLLLC
jgi:hypothetical protein